MAEKTYDCTPCSGTQRSAKKAFVSWIPAFLLVVLPKCPFCFIAFSSTMLLCGEGTTLVTDRVHQSIPTIVLSAIFCLAAVAGILLVRRDVRTLFALTFALAGSAMVMTSVLVGGGMMLYYAGTATIFLGVWLNGSLLYILGNIGVPTGRKEPRVIAR